MLYTTYELCSSVLPVIKARVIACLALSTNIDCMITDMTFLCAGGHTKTVAYSTLF